MAFHSRVLVTGSEGFTGIHLRKLLGESGFECFGLDCDLLDRDGVSAQVAKLRPSYVIHLAGVSFAAEQDIASVYSVNVVGTLNLLDALQRLKRLFWRVVRLFMAMLKESNWRSQCGRNRLIIMAAASCQWSIWLLITLIACLLLLLARLITQVFIIIKNS